MFRINKNSAEPRMIFKEIIKTEIQKDFIMLVQKENLIGYEAKIIEIG